MKLLAPPRELARLEALYSYQILDTAPERVFEDLVALAAHLCSVPIAAVSLVERNRQWFKASVGLNVQQTDVAEELAFCNHAIRTEATLVVPDTFEDERFADNPLVKGAPHLRFYAGVPLITAEGQALGTLCVLDLVPRILGSEGIGALEALARQVVSQIEMRRHLSLLTRRTVEYRKVQQQLDWAHSKLEQTVRERTAELECACARAEATNSRKDTFLATVTHELRTPLTAILGYAQLLRDGRFEGEKVQVALDAILRSGRMQQQLIEDLLDVSRMMNDKLQLQLRPVALGSIITAALEVVAPMVAEKSIDLVYVTAPDLEPIEGDIRRLQQVVWNLLINAIKFTPPRGRIEVRIYRTSQYVCLSISDTGTGIDPNLLPHVFDRFLQGEGNLGIARGGLGLGLAIVRHIVELHGGTVQAESAGRDQGATFTVRLPPPLPAPSTLRSREAEKDDLL